MELGCAARHDLIQKLSVRDGLFGVSNGAVMDDGCLISSFGFNVTVHSIIAHIQLSSYKPRTPTVTRDLKSSVLLLT